nr:uncharacterized protein LOC117218245 isoform X1 [Megalopta genalis]
MKRPRFVCTILILYFIKPYTRISCTKSDNSDKLASILLDPVLSNGDDKVRSQRELIKLNEIGNADDLANEDRITRSVLESKKHLRVGDAHQVANYFLTGGPLKGHSHFVRSANCESKNEGNDVVGLGNPVNKDDTDLSENNDNTDSADANIPDYHVALPYIPAVHHLVRRPHIHRPFLGRVNSLLHQLPPPLFDGYHHIPASGSLLRSVLHPRFHPHIDRLHAIPEALVRAAVTPMHSLLQAHAQLNNALLPNLSQPGEGSLLGSAIPIHENNNDAGSDLMNTNGEDAPVLGAYPTYPADFNGKTPLTHLVHSDYFPHLQPTGYIVKFVPHGLNTEENVDSVRTEDKDTDVTEQDDE